MGFFKKLFGKKEDENPAEDKAGNQPQGMDGSMNTPMPEAGPQQPSPEGQRPEGQPEQQQPQQ